MGALPYIQIAHHSMRIKRLGKSPLELLIGVDAVIPFLNGPGGNVQGSYSRLATAHVERHQQQLESIRHDMRELELRLQQLAKDKAKRKTLIGEFKKGDLAMVYTKGTKGKTECVWSDLVTIVQRLNEVTVKVRYPSGFLSSVPVGRLRVVTPWCHDALSSQGPFLDAPYPEMFFDHKVENGVQQQRLDLLPVYSVPTASFGKEWLRTSLDLSLIHI